MIRTLMLIAIMILTLPALAGETSRSSVLGFTQDGKYFAFEEFGVADGIGLPYASVFAIDVLNDKWVDGSPIRIKLKEGDDGAVEETGTPQDYHERERKAVAETRAKAMQQAQEFLEPLGPLGYGQQRGRNSPWELSADPATLRFTSRDLIPSTNKAWRLELEEISFPADEKCFGFAATMKGFRLRLVDEVTGIARILNEDTRIPKSRPCPLGYRLEEVLTHQGPDAPLVFAVLLRYATIGFEGNNGRLIAVTGRLR